jgi:hypothetical protein
MTLNPKLDPSCVLALPFGELEGSTAYDQSLYGNHGTIYGATRTLGKIGKALSFDGVDDYVGLGNILILSDLTIVAWIYPTTAKLQYIAAKQTSTGYNRNYVLQLNSNNTVSFVRADGVSQPFTLNTTKTVSLNSWNFVAVTDGNKNVAIYVNGLTPETFSYTLTPTTNNNPVLIGFGYGDSYTARHFGGPIDEVRIYSRALSAKEVYTHYIYGIQRLRQPRFPKFRREVRRELWPAAVV